MLGFKNFLMEEDGVGVVEMVLIVVVVGDIFKTIEERSGKV